MFSRVYEIDYRMRASLIMTMGKFTKLRTLTVRNSNEVTSPKIVRLKNFRNRRRKVWLKNKTAENYSTFMRASKQLRSEVRKTKKKLIYSKLQKDSKSFWEGISQLKGKQLKP